MAVACNKQRYKRYLFKELPADLVNYIKGKTTLVGSNIEEQVLEILKPLMDLLPQLPI